jgi:hypothetical protein
MLISFTALQIAFVLGGQVRGNGVVAPLPDHAPDDCSLTITPNQAGDDYVVEPPACRDYVEAKMGQARAAAPAKPAVDWVEQELAAPVHDFNGALQQDEIWSLNLKQAPPIAPDDNKPAAPLTPNLADINRHLYSIFSPTFVAGYPDANIEIAWGTPAYKDGAVNQARIFSAFDLEKAAAFAAKKNADGHNVYVAPA